MKLIRNTFEESGIYGVLLDENDNQIAVTLEHAYKQDDGTYFPKTPIGSYTCKKSQHRLHGMTSDFTTFQIMNVPGHENILFHWGNYNQNSDGCCLLGEKRSGDMITNSRATFKKFMDLLDGQDTFTLTVS